MFRIISLNTVQRAINNLSEIQIQGFIRASIKETLHLFKLNMVNKTIPKMRYKFFYNIVLFVNNYFILIKCAVLTPTLSLIHIIFVRDFFFWFILNFPEILTSIINNFLQIRFVFLRWFTACIQN